MSAPVATSETQLRQYEDKISLDAYSLPIHRLKKVMDDPSRTPVVLVCCGSFSPITCLHMRIFEMASDFVTFNTTFEVVGGYFSPVSDAYGKLGLESAEHRLRMCELAVDMDSDWLMVDPWEAIQEDYKPTTEVLDHFDNALNAQLGGIETTPGIRKNITIVLVAGADLIQTMSNPKIWTAEELEHIFTRYLAFVVERTGTDINEALGALKHWGHRIHIIPQLVHNDVSSTKVRMCLKRQMSVRYLVPWPVITYIKSYGLFRG